MANKKQAAGALTAVLAAGAIGYGAAKIDRDGSDQTWASLELYGPRQGGKIAVLIQNGKSKRYSVANISANYDKITWTSAKEQRALPEKFALDLKAVASDLVELAKDAP